MLDASKGHCERDVAASIREAARTSVGSVMPAKSLELRHTIHLIWELDAEIEEIESAIQLIMNEIHSPITTVPGIGTRMGAMILAEVGNFSRFDSPDKILACAGLANQLLCPYGEARLQFAILNAAKYFHLSPIFAAYLAKKRAEGKLYKVGISHAAKKLV